MNGEVDTAGPPVAGGVEDPALRGGPDVVGATLIASRALLGVAALSLVPVLDVVSLPQFRVLVLLSVLGPVRIGELAERVGVHQSTLTRTVERLGAAGLVLRAKNPANRRQVMVAATDRGLQLVRDVTEHRFALLTAILAALSAEDQATVLAGMTTFADAAGEPAIDVLAFLGG